MLSKNILLYCCRGDKKNEHAVTDVPLEVRTRELDAIYGAKLAKAEAIKAKHEQAAK